MEALSSLLPPHPLIHPLRPFNHPQNLLTVSRKPIISISPLQPITFKFDSHSLKTSQIESSPRQIAKQLNELAVKLVVGSLFLVGFLTVRPAFACPPRTTVVVEKEEATFEKILGHEPENVIVLKAILNEKMREGKLKEAAKYIQKLIKIQPDEVEWRLLKAYCYELMGQLNIAQKLFMEVLENKPLLIKALHGLAMVMHKKGEDGALFEMLDKALQLALRENRITEKRNIMMLIAQMHFINWHLDDALKGFQELVEDNPKDFRPYLCRGIIYTLQKKETEAIEQFDNYRSLVPEECPHRGFLDDVILAAKEETSTNLRKEKK